MEDYGRVISTMRKSLGMTQNELGKALNVTFQAVSKWENGLSLPDLNTISDMCKIFGITVDEFTRLASLTDEEITAAIKNKEARAAEANTAQADEGAAEEALTEVVAAPAQVETQEKIVEAQAVEPAPVAQNTAKKPRTLHVGFLVGLICALLVGSGLFIGLNCIWGWKLDLIMLFIFLGAYFVFSFIALIGHDTVVWDFFLGCLFKSVNVPGVIFTLDLDGIFFLIVYKFIIAPLITVFVWLGCVIGGFILSLFMAGFVFPFKIPKHFKETFIGVD